MVAVDQVAEFVHEDVFEGRWRADDQRQIQRQRVTHAQRTPQRGQRADADRQRCTGQALEIARHQSRHFAAGLGLEQRAQRRADARVFRPPRCRDDDLAGLQFCAGKQAVVPHHRQLAATQADHILAAPAQRSARVAGGSLFGQLVADPLAIAGQEELTIAITGPTRQGQPNAVVGNGQADASCARVTHSQHFVANPVGQAQGHRVAADLWPRFGAEQW